MDVIDEPMVFSDDDEEELPKLVSTTTTTTTTTTTLQVQTSESVLDDVVVENIVSDIAKLFSAAFALFKASVHSASASSRAVSLASILVSESTVSIIAFEAGESIALISSIICGSSLP